MNRIIKTRNNIIIFEIILLCVMLLISFKIYLLEENLIKLSKDKMNIELYIHRLGYETKDLVLLNENYVLTKNKTSKQNYLNIINNGYGFSKKIDIKNLYRILHLQPFTTDEKKKINNIFIQFYRLLNIQRKAIQLVDNNKDNKAKQIIFSKFFLDAKTKFFKSVESLIQEVDNRISIEFHNKKREVYAYFILLAIIGTLFVFINIYFFIYLAGVATQQLTEKEKLLEEVENFNDKLEEKVEQRTEEIKRLMKVKSEFLANMSHEIRTPLNAMFGFIRILQEKEFDEETHKYLSVIEKSGKNLLTIINDILDFSKIEAGKLNIEKVEVNPKEEMEIIYNLFKSVADEKNIKLNINENLEYNVITDPVRVKQVISNLLSNAIKFSKENSTIVLNIVYDTQQEKLYVEVIDEGIGIPKEKLNHIFEAFSQADNSTTRKYGGTGLGLSISSKLIELLGGKLKVKSEIDKGSTFYFSIPAKKKDKIKFTQVDKKTKLKQNNFKGNLLLVEDNKANQMFMSVVLKKLNINYDIANDGFEAIDMFKQNKYDLILMDENMPNMNGIEATKKIREIEKETHSHTPIIALTANAMEGDKERFIKAGMDYYLSKPLDVDKFTEILEKI